MIPKSQLCTTSDMEDFLRFHQIEGMFIFSQDREWVIHDLYIDHKGVVKIKMIPCCNVDWSN